MLLRNKLRFLFRRANFDSGFNQEVAFHIAERADELERSGLSRPQALRRARIEFGPAARLTEQSRAEWQWSWLEDLTADLAYTLRSFRRQPSFLAVAVLSLALGIGVNTAIFSMILEFLASQPSVRDAASLAYVRLGGNSHIELSKIEFLQNANAFPGVAGLREDGYINWRTGSETQRLFALRVTGNLFDMAAIPLLIGRGLGPNDTHAAVISHSMWRGKLAEDPNVLGRSLILDGRPHTILGVLPAGHRTLYGMGLHPDVYVPASGAETKLQLYIRFPDSIAEATARQRVALLAAELDRAIPDRQYKNVDDIRIERVAGFQRLLSSKSATLFFLLPMITVSLLLAIACLNVSGLVLARASSRQQEFAIRASLGAGGGRILRQMLTESLVLSLAGTVAGLLFNLVLTRAVSRFQFPLPIPVILQIEPDWRLLAYASLIAVASAVLVGFLPAWRASRTRASDALKQSEHQVSSPLTLRRALVIAQVAVSILVLTAAGLFARNLLQALTIPAGFDVAKTLYVSTRLAPQDYQDPARKRMMASRIHSALSAIPGVESAALTRMIPFNDDSTNGAPVRTSLSQNPVRIAHHSNEVGPAYFHTLGVPLLAGREFLPADIDAAIVNESFARRAFGAVSPVGHSIRVGNTERQIVGLVRDAKYAWLNDNGRPALFIPYRMTDDPNRPSLVQFMVRSNVDPDTLAVPLRRAVLDLDATATVEVKPMARAMGMALLPSQLGAWLLGLTGLLGLTLTSVGFYGLMVYSVARRIREIGLRVALGASPARVLRLVFSEGALLTGIGLAIGLAASVFLLQPLARFLVEGLSPSDPITFILVTVLIVGTGAAACAVPAARALRIEPSQALRYE